MRPVTVDIRNVPDALNEIMTASHENDLVELAQNYSSGNAPGAQRDFIGSSVQLSAAGIGNTADTNEDTLFTYTLPANSLALVGQGLNIFAAGSLANNADSKTINIYFGSFVFSTGAVTTANTGWTARLSVFRTASKAQLLIGEASVGTGLIAPLIGTSSQNDTAGIIIKVTAQASVANANDIVANALAVTGALSDINNAFATWLADCQKGGINRTT